MGKYAACNFQCTKDVCLELSARFFIAIGSAIQLASYFSLLLDGQNDCCAHLAEGNFLPKLFPNTRNHEASIVNEDTDISKVLYSFVYAFAELIVRLSYVKCDAECPLFASVYAADIIQVGNPTSGGYDLVSPSKDRGDQLAAKSRRAASHEPYFDRHRRFCHGTFTLRWAERRDCHYESNCMFAEQNKKKMEP
jgi:hypothetical protein